MAIKKLERELQSKDREYQECKRIATKIAEELQTKEKQEDMFNKAIQEKNEELEEMH